MIGDDQISNKIRVNRELLCLKWKGKKNININVSFSLVS